MKTGLVIGKFYPPHAGHHFLIDEAKKDCDKLFVIHLWSTQESGSINPALTQEWLKDRHPSYKVTILSKMDNFECDYDSEEAWQNHVEMMDIALKTYNGQRIPITDVYGSEQYIIELARRFDATPHLIDVDRKRFPVSGTAVRQDLTGNWNYLEPKVRSYFARQRKVVFLGAESCGTTTLTKAVANHYGEPWVPEFGRTFSEAVGIEHKWELADFIHIYTQQLNFERIIGEYTKRPLLLCDTDSYVTGVWDYFLTEGSMKPVGGNPKYLYIITDLCPWEDDGTRFGEGEFRENMQNFFKVSVSCQPYYVFATGTREERLQIAVEAIDKYQRRNPILFHEPL